MLGSLYCVFSYLLQLSQKLRIHCFACRNQYPVVTAIQTSGYFDLLACQTMLYCYWYHQTCSLKRKIVFTSTFHIQWKFVPTPTMKTVHSLDQGYIKRARPLDTKNCNCSFWKRISWFGKDCWNVCSVPFLNGYLGDGQMCSCLHRVHFQALGETNPSHQTQYLNSP